MRVWLDWMAEDSMSKLPLLLSIIALIISSLGIWLNRVDVKKQLYYEGSSRGRLSVSYFDVMQDWEYLDDNQKLTVAGFIGRDEKDDLIYIFISESHALYQIWEFGIPLFRFEGDCHDEMNRLNGKLVLLHAIIDKRHHGLTNVSKIAVMGKTEEGRTFEVVCGL